MEIDVRKFYKHDTPCGPCINWLKRLVKLAVEAAEKYIKNPTEENKRTTYASPYPTNYATTAVTYAATFTIANAAAHAAYATAHATYAATNAYNAADRMRAKILRYGVKILMEDK